MPKRYSREIRKKTAERLLAGEPVSSLAKEFSISASTLYLWKKQAFIDADLLPGVKSSEVDQLAVAQRTIEELEAELALVKAASALFNGEEPISPKDGARLPRH